VVSDSSADPNTKVYRLQWRNGALYAHPSDHRIDFTLAEAMRIAGHEEVDVIDLESGQVIWHGSEAIRGGTR
jgi:hypothetical protein